VLRSELQHQREFFIQEFKHLGERFGEHCEVADGRHADHETRLRSVESRTTWSRVIEGGLGIVSVVLVALGLKQP